MQRWLAEHLEDRFLLSGAHDQALLDAINAALAPNNPSGLAAWSSSLKDSSAIGRELPMVGTGLGATYDPGAQLRALLARLGPSYSTLDALSSALEGTAGIGDGVSVSATRDQVDDLELDVRFVKSAGQTVGLDLGDNVSLNVLGTVALNTTLDFTMTVGAYWDVVSSSAVFYVGASNDHLDIASVATGIGVNPTASLGFVDLSVSGATSIFVPDFSMQLVDPGPAAGVGRITLAELNGTPTVSLVQTVVSAASPTTLSLNVSSSVIPTGPVLSYSWADINAPVTFTSNLNTDPAMAQLNSFQTIAAPTFSFGLHGMTEVLASGATNAVSGNPMLAKLPLVNQSMADALNFPQFFADTLTSHTDVQYSGSQKIEPFSTAQQLLSLLRSLPGVGAANATMTASNADIRFTLHLPATIIRTYPINLGIDSQLHLSIPGNANLRLDTTLDITFGVSQASGTFFVVDPGGTAFSAHATLTANVTTPTTLGFLDVTITNGTLSLDATGTLAMHDPGTDNPPSPGLITALEMTNNAPSTIVTPAVTGTASASLPLSNTLFPQTGTLGVAWADVTAAGTFTLNTSAVPTYLGFNNITASSALAGLKALPPVLSHLPEGAFLGKNLQFVGSNLASSITLGSQMQGHIDTLAPFSTIQQLVSALQQKLGSANVTVSVAASDVQLVLLEQQTINTSINWNVDVNVPGANVGFQTSSSAGVTGSASASMHVGLGFDPGLTDEQRFYMLPDALSVSTLSFKVAQTGINSAANLGYLHVSVSNGSANVAGVTGGVIDTSKNATVTSLTHDPDSDGKITTAEMTAAPGGVIAPSTAQGAVQVVMPLAGLPAPGPSPRITVGWSDVASAASLAVSSQDLGNLTAADNYSGATAVAGAQSAVNLVNGWSNLGLLNTKIPLINKPISSIFDFTSKARSFFQAIANADLSTATGFDTAVQSAITRAGLDPTQVTLTPQADNNPAGGAFHYVLSFHYDYIDPTAEKFDFGSSLFSLDTSFQPQVLFNTSMDFGLNKTDGFFISDNSGSASPEVQIRAGFTAGFDQIGGVFGPLAYGVHNGSASVHLDMGIDLIDPSGGGKITVGEMNANQGAVLSPVFLSTAAGSLDMPMGLRLGTGGPGVTTEFTTSWLSSDPNNFRFGPSHSTDPADGFGPVYFELGELVHQVIGPVLQQIKSYNPLPIEIVNLLNYTIPLLNKTVADEIGDITGNDAIKLLMQIETVISELNALPAGSTINLSSYIASEPNTGTPGSPTGGDTAPFQPFVDSLRQDYSISLPILDNITASVAGILVNREDAVLIDWHPEPLKISHDVPGLTAEVPLFSIGVADATVNVSLGGSVGFFANVEIGLSTRGLTGQHIAGPGDPTGQANLLDGLFIGDNKPNAPNGPDNQEVGIFAEIHVDFGGSARVFGFPVVTVYGRMGATMQVGLDVSDVNYDPNNPTLPVSRVGLNDVGGDNRIYLDELAWLTGTFGLPCTLTLGGGLFLTGGVGFKALCTPSFLGAQICAFDKFVPAPSVPIFTFDFPCSPIPPVTLAQIGSDAQGHTALIMLPDNSTQGKHVDVSILNDRNQQPQLLRLNRYDSAGNIERQDFDLAALTSAGVISLVIEGTAGNDRITIAPEVTTVLNIQYIRVNAEAGDDSVDFGQIDETKSHLLSTSVFGGDGNDTLSGTFRPDSIEGDAGSDNILGYKGDDTIFGGTENDVISGGTGSVYIDGGDGDDQIDSKDAQNTVFGQGGNDIIALGTGNNSVSGGDGNDSIYVAGGNSTVSGDAGDDTIITEGNGHNIITGDAGYDGIYSGNGIDEIDGGTEDDYISAADGDNFILGQAGFDTILAGAGNDYINGGADGDLITAGDGDNKVYGDTGDDHITTGLGQDIIFGGDGNDLISSGEGDDFIDGGLGANTIDGGAGIDELAQSLDADQVLTNTTLSNPAGVTTFSNIERVALSGGLGANKFDVSAWSGVPVQIDGQGGYDQLISSNNTDFTLSDGSLMRADGTRFSFTNIDEVDLFGGSFDNKFDVTHYSGFAGLFGGSGLSILVASGLSSATLSDAAFSRPGYATIALNGINRASLIGTDGNDTLDASGFSGNVTLLGLGGSDTLTGGAGDDYIDGGAGGDVIVGNAGNDELVAAFNTSPASIDGGSGDDLIIGSDLADTLTAGPGRDRVYGKGGDDLISGGDDSDSLYGGDGDDTVSGDAGPDLILGWAGADVLYGQNPTDTGEDNAVDTIYGDYGTDGNEAGGGADQLFGQGGPDVLFGEGNDDVIDPGTGPGDRVDTGAGTPNSLFPPADPTPTVTPASFTAPGAIFPTEETFGLRWSEFGSSASLLGLSNSEGVAVEPAIATSPNAQYVAWADNRSGNYEIYVAMHTAAGYSELGGSAHGGGISVTAGASRRPTITLDSLGNPIVAWTEFAGASSDIHAVQWDGTAWVAMGTSLAAGGISNTGKADQARIVNTGSGPVVAWLDASSGVANVFARTFNGTAWVETNLGSAGGSGITGSTVSIPSFSMATDGTLVSVAWDQQVALTSHAYLLQYNGSGWSQLNGSATGGGVSGAASLAFNPTVAYFGGQVFVAWEQADSGASNIAAAWSQGGGWANLAIDTPGSAGFSITRGKASRPQLAASSVGLHLVWIEDRLPADIGPSMAIFTNRWNGSAFRQELPGDAAYNGIQASTELTTLSLSVDAAGHPFVAWGDLSSGSPQVYFRGNTFNVNHVYYVNDASRYQDVFTTAVGSINNTGLTPASPKDSVQSVVNAIALQSGDVIVVDTGVYTSFVMTSAVSGVLVTGSTGRLAAFSGTTLLDGAQSITLQNLSFNALTLNNTSNVDVQYDRISALALTGDSGSTVVHNLLQAGGIIVGPSNANATIEHNTFINSSAGITLNGATNVLVRDNRMSGVAMGISLAGASSGEVSGNYISGSGGMVLAAAFTGAITGNDIQGGAVGVDYRFNTPFYGNRIHDSATGITIIASPTLNLGATGPAIPNEIFGNATGVQVTAGMQNQHIYGNGVGVTGSGTLGAGSLDLANLIELNAIGADFTGTIQLSRFSRNAIGVRAEQSNLIINNVFYGNAQAGVKVSSLTAAQVLNNSFYAIAGDNVHIDGASANIVVRNNILWSQNGGYDLYVATDSQAGFDSDYNNLYASNGGLVAWWEKPFADLYDWQIEVDLDLHSIGYIAPSPFLDDPQFINPATGDLRLSLASTSINAGDPAAAFASEPAPNGNQINLGAYGGTGQAEVSPPAYVHLDYPNRYLDWEATRAQIIRWHVYNVANSVKLEVTDPNGVHVADIATVSAAAGQYLWSPQASNILPDPNTRYRIRIMSLDDPAAFELSREVFSVPPASNQYFINDGSSTNDVYATALGNNRNTGRFADAPKADVLPILRSYALTGNDTVFVDTGNYIDVRDLIINFNTTPNPNPGTGLGDDQGFAITGPTDPAKIAYLDRANPFYNSTHVELNNASFMTLSHLTLVGAANGIRVHTTSTNFRATQVTVANDSNDGINLDADATASVLDGVVVYNHGGYGVYVAGSIERVVNSTIYNSAKEGLYFANGGAVIVQGNTIHDTLRGIFLPNGNGAIIGSTNLGLGNRVYNNTFEGIYAGGSNITVAGNAVFGHNSIFYAGIRFFGTGVVAQNIVYNNYQGITASNQSGLSILNNRAYANTTSGIDATANLISGNVVYENAIGISLHSGGASLISNNLAYRNSQFGIYANQIVGTAGSHAQLFNNTVYQNVGEAVRIENNSNFVELRNNDLFADGAGVNALSVATDSQSGFVSDFNLLFGANGGNVGFWQGAARPTLSAWQNSTFTDSNSLSQDPLFVSIPGDDYHEQSLYGSNHGGSLAPILGTAGLPVANPGTTVVDAAQSPAIDRGDPSFSFANEPSPNGSFINIGAYGNTSQASLSPTTYVLVTRPDGGEVWPEGQTFPITWRAETFTGTVNIDLLHQGNPTPALSIATGAANNGSFTWPIPTSLTAASDYVVRVSRQDGSGLSDTSNGPFTIAPVQHNYYVNDSTFAPGDYTTAPGDDVNNDGLDPSRPKASISAVLQAYHLTSADTILVDRGTYNLTANIVITSDDAGVSIVGYFGVNPGGSVLSRGNTASGSYVFELQAASGITLDHLTITAASSGVFASNTSNSTHVTISNCIITANNNAGVNLDTSNTFATIANNQIFGTSDPGGNQFNDIILSANDALITGNTIYGQGTGSGGAAIYLSGLRTIISNNDIHSMNGGIQYNGPIPFGAPSPADIPLITGNTIHDNHFSGINGSNLNVVGNTVFGHTDTFASGISVGGYSNVSQNILYNNLKGISATGQTTVTANRVFHNSDTGIVVDSTARAQANQVYSNGIGINSAGGWVANNLVYANTTEAILLRSANLFSGNVAHVLNNTVYQPTGEGIRLESSNGPIDLRNNIIAVGAGHAFSVASDAEASFTSDYNLIWATGTGLIASWAGIDVPTLTAWSSQFGFDPHSLATDPGFLNPAGLDGILGYTTSDFGADDNFHLNGQSPAIDAGDPLSYFLAEPAPNGGRVNLGFDGDTALANTSRSPLLQIVTPNGGDKLQADQTYNLQWRSWDLHSSFSSALINVGGLSAGNWLYDNFSLAYQTGQNSLSLFGTIDTSGVANPAPLAVYQSAAVGISPNSAVSYLLPAADGTYTIRLHFADFSTTQAGQRVFDIKLQGAVVKSGYDILADAGAGNKATTQTFTVTASSGHGIRLDLVATATSNLQPLLCGIELTGTNPAITAPPTYSLDFSPDNGLTWTSIATGLSDDAFGQGSFAWTPATPTPGIAGLVRVTATSTAGSFQDQSDQPFRIAPAGHSFYINDSSTAGDVFTTAVGNDLNSGKTPNQPMATLPALLAAYTPHAGDTIYIDHGNYSLLQNVLLTSALSGVRIQGPPDASAVFDRGDSSSGKYVFEMRGGNNITIDHLTLINAYAAVFGAANSTTPNSDSLTVSNCTITGNQDSGINLQFGNNNALITGNTIFGNPADPTFLHRQNNGISIGALNVTVSNNTVYSSRVGITATQASDIVSGNIVHDNTQFGILTLGGTVAGNTVYNQSASLAVGIEVSNGTASDNVVYNNYDGILVVGTATNNRVFNNSDAGILVGQGSAIIQGNQVYSNATGVIATSNCQVLGNLIYANTTLALLMRTTNNQPSLIISNTIYQPLGDAIQLQAAPNVQLRNNIVQADSGHGLIVPADSETAFSSDYNLFYSAGPGKLTSWQGVDFTDLTDWFYRIGEDAHSLSADPMFINPAGADGILGYNTATNVDGGLDDVFHVQGTSPAIDAGDPSSLFLQEPAPNGGRINLGFDGNTPQAATSSNQLVQLFSPIGREKFLTGQNVSIQWRSSGLTTLAPVALINAGGPSTGIWSADAYRIAGNTAALTSPVDLSHLTSPPPAAVFQSVAIAAFGMGNRLAYQIPVPDGSYTIRLDLVDPYSTFAGQAIFNINLQGQTVAANFDTFAQAGGPSIAIEQSFPVTAVGGSGILLELVNQNSSQAVLAGIQVLAANAAGSANPTFNIDFSTDGGVTWGPVAFNVPVDSFGLGSFDWSAGPVSSNDLIRVTAADGSHPQDRSRRPFLVAPFGNDYYINDGSTVGDVLSTAPGNNANTGRSPDSPMADLAALLAAYHPHAGDVVHIDTGNYLTLRNIFLTPSTDGVQIVGPSSAAAIFDRGNQLSDAAIFEFQQSIGVTIDHLTLINAGKAIYGNPNYVNGGQIISNNIFHDHTYGGIWIDSGIAGPNTSVTVSNNLIYGGAVNTVNGINLNSANITVTGNTVHDTNTGIAANASSQGANSTLSGNEVYASVIGINASQSLLSNQTGLFRFFITGNSVHDNTSTGMSIGGGISASDNTIFNQSATNATGMNVGGGAQAIRNAVYTNYDGIAANGAALVADNRVFHNSHAGIVANSQFTPILRNHVYSGSIGLLLQSNYGGLAAENLIYANSNQAILVQFGAFPQIVNNTIYQPVGDAIRIQSFSSRVQVENNIIQVLAGYGIYVGSDSQSQFVSDRNLFFTTTDPNAHIGFWNSANADTLAAWQTTTAQDANSVYGDPKFVDTNGADNVFGYVTTPTAIDGGADDNFQLSANSPAIDRGNSLAGPQTDIVGSPHLDDPATPNLGTPDYTVQVLSSNLFTPTGGTIATFITLPFTFPFYDQSTTAISLSPQGWILMPGITTGTDPFINNPVIAPYFDTTSTISASAFVDTSVPDQVRIRWAGVNTINQTPVNFAAILFSNGTIRFDYGSGNTGLQPRVGISRGDGQHYLVAPYDQQTNLNNVSSVEFDRVPGFVDLGAYEFGGSSADVTPPTVVSTVPTIIDTGGTTGQTLTQIQLVFSEPVNIVDANAPANYELRYAGANGIFNDGDDQIIALAPSYALNSASVFLNISTTPVPTGLYRLTVFSDSTRSIHDLSGNALDGDRDGIAGGSYIRTFTVAVANTPPTVTLAQPSPILEGGTYTASGSFADPDNNTWTATVDYGDGTGPVALTLNPDKTFSLSHVYGRSGTYTINVVVSDSIATGTATVSLTVQNVAPTVTIQNAPASVTVGTPIHLTSQVTDPGIGDTFTYAWAVKLNGNTVASGNASDITFTPSVAGSYIVSVDVTDADNATGSDSVTILAAQATVGATAVNWGTAGSAALQTDTDGVRLLPGGRKTSLPWANINRIQITLDRPATLTSADVTVTGLSVANYGPVTITGSGTTYTITFANPIAVPDRVTLTISNAAIATFTRRLDVLPGDVNDDGLVNSQDLVLIRNMLPAFGAKPTLFGDINGDGVVDINDYNLLRRYIGTRLP